MNVSILHYAAPPVVGGVESTIYHHARLLSGSGYQVKIFAGRGEEFDDRIPFIQLPEIDSRYASVIQVGNQLASGTIKEDFISLRDKLHKDLQINLGDSDVLIVHNAITLHKNLPLTAALRLISDSGKLHLIAWCHDFAWQDKLYTPDLHPGYPWDLLNNPWPGVRYVTVSEHRRNRLSELLKLPRSFIDVVPPGIDFHQFLSLSPLSQEIVDRLQLIDAEPLLLLPARITRRKNIEFSIQVIQSLSRTYPNAILIISGPPGPHNPKNIAYLNSLRDLRAKLQVESNVHFLYELRGEDQVLNIPDETIAELYRVADVLIFPSYREGFGIPVLEAGLARTPVFAANIPSVQESSSGLINVFDPNGDPDEVAARIHETLISDQAYQLRKRVIKKYTWQSILKKQIIPMIEEFGQPK